MADPESSSRALNPGMVYRPVSPPSNQFDAQDEHQQPIKMRFNLVAVLRFLIAVFAIAATCTIVPNRYWGSGTVVVVVVLEYISLAWNVLQIIGLWVPKGQGGFYWRLRLGKISLVCGSEDEDRAGRTALLGEGGGDDKKEFFTLGLNIMDIGLALLLTIFIPIDARIFSSYPAFTGLSFTVFALELTVGILSTFRVCKGVRAEIYPDQSSAERFQYQIRLPVPEGKKSQGQQVSIASEDV